jgi:hypothetical protein|tara:strand:+ start:530 stop:709 length:180 start_codon:yes stop_codon:yes gene_type:complete
VGELIDFREAKEERAEAQLKELQLSVEIALSGLGPVTSGPMWLDPDTGDIVLLVEIEVP